MVLSEAYSKPKAFECIDGAIAAQRAAHCQDGALVDMRKEATASDVIIIGDLHARLDVFRCILEDSCALARMARNELVVIILGDAVHNEVHCSISDRGDLNRLQDMTPSVPMIQTIMGLKSLYPNNLYYLLGNHDYPSLKFSKVGVNQGDLYRAYLKKLYGDEYVEKYREFLSLSPLMVVGDGFVANHAGPCDATICLDDIRRRDLAGNENDPIVEQLLWRRWKTPEKRLYYDASMVNAFLRTVVGDPDAYYFVGHTQRLLHYAEYQKVSFAAQLMAHHFVIFGAYNESGYVFFQNGAVEKTLHFHEVAV